MLATTQRRNNGRLQFYAQYGGQAVQANMPKQS